MLTASTFAARACNFSITCAFLFLLVAVCLVVTILDFYITHDLILESFGEIVSWVIGLVYCIYVLKCIWKERKPVDNQGEDFFVASI